MKYIIALLTLAIIGCKSADVDPNGKYITGIERNVISIEGGQSIMLDNSENAKIIYLVRHAEKDTVPKNNPILTEAGYQRSYKLAELLKKSRIDAIYSTLYNRTIHTVDSLANAKGLKTMIYQPKELKQISIDISESTELNHFLIAGHSNTTPALANVFMEEKIIDSGFDESDYDNMLVINILPSGEKKLYQLRFK